MNHSDHTKSARLYRLRQHQLRMQARQLRVLKRLCAAMLAADLVLAISYFVWRGPILSMLGCV